MASKTTTPDFEENADVQVVPEDWQWETTREESPTAVTFNTPGEDFVGMYEKRGTIEPEGKDPFDVFLFRGRDGKQYALPTMYALDKAIDNGDILPGVWSRITYVKDINTARGLNPMKDIRIQTRK